MGAEVPKWLWRENASLHFLQTHRRELGGAPSSCIPVRTRHRSARRQTTGRQVPGPVLVEAVVERIADMLCPLAAAEVGGVRTCGWGVAVYGLARKV